MVPGRTIANKGDSTVIVKSTGHEKSRYTCVLAVMADGTKLPPMLIFKRKTLPKCKFPDGVVIHCNEKGWMDEEGVKIWLKKVWQRRPGGLRKQRSLLVWDRFSAHLTGEINATVRQDSNTDVAVIPGGLTGILQPLDVSINKPFKNGLRERWTAWMTKGGYTDAGVDPLGKPKIYSSKGLLLTPQSQLKIYIIIILIKAIACLISC